VDFVVSLGVYYIKQPLNEVTDKIFYSELRFNVMTKKLYLH